MKNCYVAQSGGPTAAINASLAGVIKGVLEHSDFDRIYGSLNGITGILEGRYLDLTDIFYKEETLNLLKRTPAMYLGSCRFKLPDFLDDDSAYIYIFQQFEALNIKAFFYGHFALAEIIFANFNNFCAKLNGSKFRFFWHKICNIANKPSRI